MQNIILRLWGSLTPLERRKFIIVLILTILMAFLEMLGVISIVPFLAVLSSPDIIQSDPRIHYFYQILNSSSYANFVIKLGIFSMILILTSALFKIIHSYGTSRFIS